MINIEEQTTTNTVIFLGAGISYVAGVPIQSEILKTICNNKEIFYSNNGNIFIKFLKDNFGLNENCDNLPTIEEIYSFLDFFISQNENLNSKYPVVKLKNIWNIFTQLICSVIETEVYVGNKADNAYNKFWQKLVELNHKISIITTNYDSCFFESFDNLYSQNYLLNYNIDFANYYDEYMKDINSFFWWDKAEEGVNNTKIIDVYKLHGSLEWLYCSNCNKVMHLPFFHANYNLENGELKQLLIFNEKGESIQRIATCPVDKCKYQILIVPPTYNKNFNNSILKDLYFKALLKLRMAKNIIFIGYSFPDADYHIKALFNRVNMTRKNVVVIDKFLDDNKKRKYLSICNHVKFKEIAFENCIDEFTSYVSD